MSAFGEEEKKREMIIAWLEVISISGKIASFKVSAQLSHHLQYGKVGRILFIFSILQATTGGGGA